MRWSTPDQELWGLGMGGEYLVEDPGGGTWGGWGHHSCVRALRTDVDEEPDVSQPQGEGAGIWRKPPKTCTDPNDCGWAGAAGGGPASAQRPATSPSRGGSPPGT